MRVTILLLNLLIYSSVLAQKDLQLTQETTDLDVAGIAAMEQRSHQKLFNAREMATLTSASTNFDVKYYRAEWEVDPAVNYIKGKLTAYYVMTGTDHTISFDLVDNLAVTSVLQRSAPLTTSHSNHTLQITFPTSVASGTLDSVSIFYEGIPPSSGNGSFIVSSHGSPATPVMWTLSEPFGSRDWWPCKNGLDDKADQGIDIFITHPSIYTAAANGLLKSITPLSGSKSRTHWKHTYSIASYLVCFAVTNYTVFNNSVIIGDVSLPMQTFCYPENLGHFQSGTPNTLDALQLFSNMFGTYPFIDEKYGHVQFGWGGGMEHQTNSFMVNLGENLVAHELAHQWFGDKITCGNWEDIWLNEGFATHLASIYRENKYPASISLNRINEIAAITSVSDGSVKVSDVTSVSRIFNSRLSYTKGSHLLYMLRWILGDVVFFNAVRNYLNDSSLAYNFATTENLKSHLEAASGKDLTYFFDQWYSGQGYPSYQLKWLTSGNSVSFNLKQTTSHFSVNFFKLPVPLLFKNETTGEQKLVVANNTVNDQNFTENLGFVAESVTIDPDYWLITKNNTTEKVSGSLPVTFTYIKALCKENNVQLSWGTSSEQNADFFEIQKSTDALTWSKIGSVDAVGNSVASKNYSFIDPSIAFQNTYYRIVENDMDGKTQYTRILEKDCSQFGDSDLKIAPNPVQDKLILGSFDKNSPSLSFRIYDLTGKLISQKENIKTDDKGQKVINVTGLNAGLYILQIHSYNELTHRSLKFIKE